MFYQGSKLFSGLAQTFFIPLDQINFIAGETFAFIAGLLFRKCLNPSPENVFKRQLASFLIGFSLAYFCYGLQIAHLLIQAFVSYSILLILPRNISHLLILVFSLGYLSGLHIYRLIYDYGNYTIEITGGLMIATEKLSSLAFFYYDGMKNEEELSDEQKKNQIKKAPKLIEFLSYMFNFQTVLIGPLVFYQDYMDFITGDNILKYKKNEDRKENFFDINRNISNYTEYSNGFFFSEIDYSIKKNGYLMTKKKIIEQPDNTKVILKKLLAVLGLILVYKNVTIVYKVNRNLEPEILLKPLWYRFFYHYISVSSQRFKYYLAWGISDLVCNASGLGFNGYDENGNVKWDLCTSVHILKLETSTSVKCFLDNWNITTQKWFRRVGYERMPTGKTLAVFILSALWHGFYPGYYLTFVLAAFLVYAGRGIRQNIRPFFLKNKFTFAIYSLLTWFGTICCLNYVATSFVLLEFQSSIKFYNSWYWIIHILAILSIILFPYKKNQKDH